MRTKEQTNVYYLAGPMSGRPQFNYPLFIEAAKTLRGKGLTVVSPAEIDDPEDQKVALASKVGDLAEFKNETGQTWGDFLSRDVKMIADTDIDAIVLLPEWETSKGARLEAFVAVNLGYPAYRYVKGVLIAQSPKTIMEKINEGVF